MYRKVLTVTWALVLILTLFPASHNLCLAQTETPAYSLTGYEYIVRPGDVLEITVWGHSNLSGTVTVDEEGKISLAGLPGDIRVAGMKISEVQAGLTDMLTYYLRNPVVSVTLRETRMIRVTVIGSVRSPGVYSFRSEPTVISALASAGGYLAEADLTQVRITGMHTTDSTISDAGFRSITVDIEKVLSGEKEMSQEPGFILADGDIVYVPGRARTVSVLGEIQRPGVYNIDTTGEGTSLFDIIAAAGGPGINADTSCVRVTRIIGQTSHTLEIDLDAGDSAFKLLPGDAIYVPRAIRVQVLGQVKNPGSYQLKAKSTLIHAIAQAGGTLDSADTSYISLHRAGGEGGIFTIDLDLALTGKLPQEDLILEDQDTIIVPEVIREVSVLGAVNRPGVYRIHKNSRILEVLAQAGGISDDGDGASAILTRRLESGETQRLAIDLEELQSAAGEGDNLPVYDGDIIYVPKAITVMVLGKVKGPGAYTLRSTGKLMDAISRAGGILPDGDQTSVTLTRNDDGEQEVREFDIKAIMAGANELNISLMDGDIIFVPDLVREISVLGEVARPGVYQIRDDSTLLECLAQAGGITEMGDATAVRITRYAEDGTHNTYSINTDRIDTQAGAGLLRVMPGDIIYVPRAISVQVLGEVARPGVYRMKAGSRVSDAIALAGGLTDDADGEQVVVTSRNMHADSEQADTVYSATGTAYVTPGTDNLEPDLDNGVRIVDVTRIFMGSNLSDNTSLLDQDTVFVPKLSREVVVVGEVERPGLYKLPRGAKLMDAIATAGGPTKRAALEAVCIFREGRVTDGEQVVIGHDNLFFTGKAEENPLIEGKDIVYVPSTNKIDWDRVFSFLSGLKLIKDLFIR